MKIKCTFGYHERFISSFPFVIFDSDHFDAIAKAYMMF